LKESMTLMGDGRMAEWWQEAFDDSYLHIYARMDRSADESASYIVDRLALPPGVDILDLCGGYGRVAIPLAQRGYRMTVLDLSEHLLAEGKRRAKEAGVEIHWLHGDMREIPSGSHFDAIINIFTSFGYFDDDTENERVLQGAAQTLNPGGVLLIDVIHRDALLWLGIAQRWEELARYWLLEENHYDLITSRWRSQRWLIPKEGGPPKQAHHSIRVYSAHELHAMCQRCGLEVIEHFGGLNGSTLTKESRRLVTLAKHSEARSTC
jgi:2-polyprenyl-3-methyl-5-hydroxy-6-metoxy-1,4-benzoquinol methylase